MLPCRAYSQTASLLRNNNKKKEKQILDSLLAARENYRGALRQSWRISPRVSASPGQQNEFFHPVIPNIRNLHDSRGAESNGNRAYPRSHVPRFTMREKSSFANTANGCNVTLRARELFLANLHFFFPVASRLSLILPSPPSFFPLFFLFIPFDREPDGRSAADTASYRRGPVIEFI